MDEGQLFGRGISFPPRIGPDGRVTWSVGIQNIREAIRIILLTESQERLLLPEFGGGLQTFLFKPNIATTHRLIQERITQMLGRWEPRITVESVIVEPDPVNNQTAIVTIHYKLVTTGTSDQIGLTIRLTG
jgi:hypothetical protein